MVVPVNASVAQVAVAAPRRPNDLAVRAETARLHGVQQLDEIELLVLLDDSGVAQPHYDAIDNGRAKQTLTPVEQPVQHRTAEAKRLVGGDMQETESQAHQQKVADESEGRLALLLKCVPYHQTIAKDGPFVSQDVPYVEDHGVDHVKWLSVLSLLVNGQRHVINRFHTRVVKCVPVGAFDQQLLDALRAAVLLRRLHGEVERCQALAVSHLSITAPRQDVVESQVGAREARPVQRRALAFVLRVDVETFLEEVSDGDRLVTLRRDVKHIDALLVDNVYVCPVLHEKSYHANVAVERSEVQRCEAILPPTRAVNPRFQLVLPLQLQLSINLRCLG